MKCDVLSGKMPAIVDLLLLLSVIRDWLLMDILVPGLFLAQSAIFHVLCAILSVACHDDLSFVMSLQTLWLQDPPAGLSIPAAGCTETPAATANEWSASQGPAETSL